MNETTYTITYEQIGNHLEVTVVELGITVDTPAGKLSQDDAFDAAHTAIETWLLQQRSHETVKAS